MNRWLMVAVCAIAAAGNTYLMYKAPAEVRWINSALAGTFFGLAVYYALPQEKKKR